MSRYLVDPPEELTRRARYFVNVHALQAAPFDVDQHRERWLRLSIPAIEIDRVAAYARRWGGLALPPAQHYDGGPRILNPDTPEGSPDKGWWFEAGAQRTAVPYTFMIGPHGEFGIHGDRWTPLHSTVKGWVESVALAHHASTYAKTITKVTGQDVDALQLDAFPPFLLGGRVPHPSARTACLGRSPIRRTVTAYDSTNSTCVFAPCSPVSGCLG